MVECVGAIPARSVLFETHSAMRLFSRTHAKVQQTKPTFAHVIDFTFEDGERLKPLLIQIIPWGNKIIGQRTTEWDVYSGTDGLRFYFHNLSDAELFAHRWVIPNLPNRARA